MAISKDWSNEQIQGLLNATKNENDEENKNGNDIQNILGKLKENIQNNDNIDSFDFITNELSVITELINHIKENKN